MPLNEVERRNRHSGDYFAVLENLPISRLQRLLPFINSKLFKRVVDFACGASNFFELIHDRRPSAEGIDFSPDFVATVQRRASAQGIRNISYHRPDIVELCSEHSDEYDVITELDFSGHIYDEDFLRIFGGAHRILKPSGALFIHTPKLDFFFKTKARLNWYDLKAHANLYKQ